MEIIIDYAKINQFLTNPPHIIAWEIFKSGGWVVFLYIFFLMARQVWLMRRQNKFAATLSNTLLAIDIPKNNEQMPKAVESIFAHLAGAHGGVNFKDKWWTGKFQECFSLELISINGFIQFLIRTPSQFRDLVEAAVYSQYPDAEITEVEDYTKDFPAEYPDDVWDVWGTEFVLAKESCLPIKTYPEFEHVLSAEFKDPMNAILEQLSSLKEGEQLWFQIIIKPISQDWVTKGEALMKKIMGQGGTPGKGIFKNIKDEIINIMKEMRRQLLALPGDMGGAEKSSEKNLMTLIPKEKNQLEGIETKIAKIGYECAMRLVYAARHEVMNTRKVVNGFIGTIKQFNTNDLNAIKPDLKRTGTSTPVYYLVEKRKRIRKRKIVANYKNRSIWAGSTPFILNIEELATLYHFPLMTAKAPMVQKTESRRGEPPATVPYADLIKFKKPVQIIKQKPIEEVISEATKIEGIESKDREEEPPANLPIG